jgi:uncharacterized protein (PEP-CTERM system associated)
LGGLGWQKIEDASLREEPSGPIWSVGFQYKPGPRTTLKVNYNHQFDSQFFTYSGSYAISPRTSLSFEHTESIQTTSQALGQNAAFLGVDDQGRLVDLRTGLPFDPNANPLGLQNDTVHQKSWTANFSSTSGRNHYGIQLFRTENVIDRTSQKIDQNGVSMSYSRELSRRLTGSVAANYRITDTNGAQVTTATGTPIIQDDTTHILLNGSLRYTLTKDMAVNFTASMSRNLTANSTSTTRENSAAVVLTKTF